MAIYDIHGNVISTGDFAGNGEILDGSVTPVKTSFFNETPIYDTFKLGTMESGLIYSAGNLAASDAYIRTADYVAVEDGAEVLYLAYSGNISTMSRIICYDAAKTVLGEATRTPYAERNGYVCQTFAMAEGTAYIKACFAVAVTAHWASYAPIDEPDNVGALYFSCRDGYKDKLLSALSIPNQDALNRFNGKTMIVAGDSITEANQTCNNYPWSAYLAKWLGLTVYNDGQGGTGFAKGYYDRGCTILRVETKWADLYPADPDVILVMGNMNDGTGSGAGYGEIYGDQYDGLGKPPQLGTPEDDGTVFSQYGIVRRLLESLIERYPLAKIGMISSTPRDYEVSHWSDKPLCHGKNGWYEDYITAQKYVCEDLNVPFLDLYHNNVLRPWNADNVAAFYWDGTDPELTQDGFTGATHPNEIGHLEGIARPVLQWMLGWM